MSHAGHACPKKAAGTTRPPWIHSLRHPSRPGVLVAAGGRKRPDHHADRILQGTPRTLSRHFTHCSACLSHPPRGGRAAGQYAYTFSPQRPAAKPAPRGQARLWGMIATHTQRHGTQHYATRTQLDAHSPNATQRERSRKATQHRRNRTQHRDATQLERRTRIRNGTRQLSNARNNRGGETRDRATQHTVAARYCGQLRNRLTPNHKLELTMEGHSNPPDVLFAFPVLNSRAKATQRRNMGNYKKMTLDCAFRDSGDCFAPSRVAEHASNNEGISEA